MDFRSSWFCTVLLGGFLLLSLSSCDDSSNVGLGVGPDSLQGGEPHTIDVVPALGTTTAPPQTGLELQFGGPQVEQDTWRFLVGRVDDPVGGTIEANGYIDVIGRSSLPEELLDADASSLDAELRFTTSYLHGDSLSSVDVRVLPLTEEADMNGAEADSTFPAGAEITTATITPTDSLVTIDLPQQWVSDNADVLRDTTSEGSSFQDAFHGFKLAANGGNAVVGFSSVAAGLRLHLASDTTTAADYPGLKTFTHIERTSPPSPPADRVLLQDGVGVGLTMDWDFDANPLDSLRNFPLNRAEIQVPIDTTTLKQNSGSDSFVRPLASGFRVTATRMEGPNVPSCASVGTVQLPGEDRVCAVPLAPEAAPGAALVPNNTAFPIFQTSLLQGAVFNQFRVEVADRRSTSISTQATIEPGLPSTLPVLIPRPEAQDIGSPSATLTITPL